MSISQAKFDHWMAMKDLLIEEIQYCEARRAEWLNDRIQETLYINGILRHHIAHLDEIIARQDEELKKLRRG